MIGAGSFYFQAARHVQSYGELKAVVIEMKSETRNTIIEGQQKAYRDCIQELDSLVGLKTSPSNADGSQLSNEEYGQRRAKLLKEKAGLEELLRDVGNRIVQQLRIPGSVGHHSNVTQKLSDSSPEPCPTRIGTLSDRNWNHCPTEPGIRSHRGKTAALIFIQ